MWDDHLVAKTGKRTGRPPFEPTRQQRAAVIAMKGLGATDEECARGIIDPNTLRHIGERTLQKHFAAELREAPGAVKSGIMGFAVRLGSGKLGATPQATTMAIFLLKSRFGFKDGNQRGAAPEPGAADQIEIVGGLPPRKRE